MAYRRRQGITKASTFKEEIYHRPDKDDDVSSTSTTTTTTRSKLTASHSFSPSTTSSATLAAQSIRASGQRRDSPLSSVSTTADSAPQRSKVFGAYEETGGRDARGFWNVLARKAKSIIEDDNVSQVGVAPLRSSPRFQMPDNDQQQVRPDGLRRIDSPTFRKGLDKITTSLNQIGDSFERAYEEGRTIMENRTADIRHQIRRKGTNAEEQNQEHGGSTSWQQPAQPKNQMNHENQLKASRDVAMATAAKAKLLLRELKTIKADLAFAKQRCSQLEDENKLLRESREKGGNAADDDLIRLQLETLLAEKARLARENSVYARENRFLREIVEYHQLTMQDVLYLDEGIDDFAEVHSYSRMLDGSPTSPTSPSSPSENNASTNPPPSTREVRQVPSPLEQIQEEAPLNDVQSCPTISVPEDDKAKNVPPNKKEEKATSIPEKKEAETKAAPSHQQENANGSSEKKEAETKAAPSRQQEKANGSSTNA
ncbi:hypothetical protein Tsubulata_000081 [Turnera subulata]|uniref:Uncharacterized protein n=1 Tax=Turnera subulata TaxID=218843 RepID=A0A9Q0FJC2_9ROSI|nr:hypothetical protein Tsubulata_000081 [Turnera subulata]